MSEFWHYLVNLEAALGQVFRSLRPGGLFVFSVEHPIFTAPQRPGFQKSGAVQDWPLSSYFAEGEREVDWLGAPVRKQHRTISRSVAPRSERGLCANMSFVLKLSEDPPYSGLRSRCGGRMGC